MLTYSQKPLPGSHEFLHLAVWLPKPAYIQRTRVYDNKLAYENLTTPQYKSSSDNNMYVSVVNDVNSKICLVTCTFNFDRKL